MSELDLRHPDNDIVQFDPITNQRRELLRRTICRDLTDDEMDLFVAVCNRRRLDPFVKQIHAVKRRQWNAKLDEGRGGYEEIMVIQTGIDGFRLVAERTHERDGTDGPWWCDQDGQWRDVWLSKDPPAAAKVIAYRKGHTRPYPGIAHWTEYVQTYKDKKGNVQPTQMWRDMPAGQLAKCAEALAWRKAFPEELSGIYTDDEMAQAEVDEYPDRVGGDPQPAHPVGSNASRTRATQAEATTTRGRITLPTLEQIQAIEYKSEVYKLIGTALAGFREHIKRAVREMHDREASDFQDDATVDDWKQVLEYALELAEQREHETSAAGGPPRPAADHQSDPGPDREAEPGSDPNLLDQDGEAS